MNFSFLAAMSTSKLSAIIASSAFALLIIISLIITIIYKEKTAVYDKDGFVHKVMKHDYSLYSQVAKTVEFFVLVPAIVIFFLEKIKYNYWISLGLLGLALIIRLSLIITKLRTNYCRIEYNRNALYKFGLFGTSVELPWKNVKNVTAKGVGRNRVFTFEGKNDKKIRVPFKMVGSYEFIVFCEKQLDGKQFEVIKMGKARQ